MDNYAVHRFEALMKLLFACIDAESGTHDVDYSTQTDECIEELADELKELLGLPEDFNL